MNAKQSSEASLKSAVAMIEKQFGKGSIMRLNSEAPVEKAPSISTGSLMLDTALGIGGVPKGRIVEIYGSESAGKSTLALSIVAQAQKAGGQAAYIDVEHALDPNYAKRIGVDIDNLLLSQPNLAEEALQITEQLISTGAISVVVVDSVAALVPQAEQEGEMGDMQVGAQARLMSKAMRKLTGVVNKTGTVVIFINQLRQKVGVMFGNPEVTPGGQALKFYSSVRIDLRRIEQLKSGSNVTGIRVRARVVKNKMAPPFRTAEFDVMFNEGISREAELIDLGAQHNLVKRSGAFYSYGEHRLGQGKEAACNELKSNTDLAKKLEAEILSAIATA